MTALLVVLLVIAAIAAGIAGVRLREARREAAELRERIVTLEADLTRGREGGQRFLAAATHELRTPLSAILGYQELLAEGLYGPLNAKAEDAVKRIGRAAEQLLHLLDGTLEVARMDVAGVELSTEPVELFAVLAKAAENARLQAVERGAELEVDIAAELPRITTDPERLERILDLALSAAVRSSPGSKLHMSATPDGSGVVLSVTGTALAPESLPATDQAASGEKIPSLGAAGLRLSIAHRLARLLGGDLVLEQSDGRTTLRLIIAALPSKPD